MKRITIVGELNGYASYGKISASLIRRVQEKGYFPSVRALGKGIRIPDDLKPLLVYSPQPEPKEIMASPPHQIPTPGKRVAFFSTWESTKLMPFSVSYLNRATVVCVPCAWNADNFKKNGIRRPIEIVRLGVDPSIFAYRPMDTDGLCVFGCAGNLLNGSRRKGVADCITIFQETFQGIDDVRLRIKCMPACKIDGPDDLRIELVKELLTDDGLADWYQTLTCFISFARAEGHGWHQQEAMAIGRPVVCAPYAGLADFINEKNGYPVAYSEVEACEIWKGHGNWAEPDARHFGNQLMRVYKNRKEAQELGWAASKSVEPFTSDKFNDHLLSIHDSLL